MSKRRTIRPNVRNHLYKKGAVHSKHSPYIFEPINLYPAPSASGNMFWIEITTKRHSPRPNPRSRDKGIQRSSV